MNAEHDLQAFLRLARPAKLRSMRQFAEAEIAIPSGPHRGRRFRCDRQPYTGLWFDAIDAGPWNRFVATGPTQSGKTLTCFVIPVLYHLFELGETVICGLPDMDMAGDKWREDLLPAIEASTFRRRLPLHGGGSRGGRVESIQFRNGATLKFMSGGGGDKSRAGFTSRVVAVTETDGLDRPGGASRESDKVTQLEARTRAYGARKRVYLECTVSTENGRTWQEYLHGTHSRIVLPCPGCREWVSPEREHLVGWQGATTEVAADAASAFSCPNCGQVWTENERARANAASKLLHAGQTIDGPGDVRGEPAATNTLGFRWSAVNNLFLTAGEVGADEWRASRATNEENAEREMRQFVWCLPTVPPIWDDVALAVADLAARVDGVPRGQIPPDCDKFTAAIDIGKYLCHWAAVAWKAGATGHVVDYGRIEVASSDLGVEPAVMAALREFRDLVQAGWPPQGRPDAAPLVPGRVWIDAGYVPNVVYAFCRESGDRFMPAIGRGAAQQRTQWYNRPTRTGAQVKHIGEGYHINLLASENLHLVEVDADHWKTWLHQRLATPASSPGAMTFYQAPPQEHLALAKHLTAETKVEEFVAGKGSIVRWERVRKQNHWLDALYNASAGGHFVGVRLVPETTKPAARERLIINPGFGRPDGRPWIPDRDEY